MPWRVYLGNHEGGPVDRSVIVATVDDTEFHTPSMPIPSHTKMGVRSYDPATDLEETNVDVVIELIVDDNGVDASGRPSPALALTVAAVGADGVTVAWRHLSHPRLPDPDRFYVYFNDGDEIDWTAEPAREVSFVPNSRDYTVEFTGLAEGTGYVVNVRAARGAAIEPNTMTVRVYAKGVPPLNVVDFRARPVFREANYAER